MQPIWILPIHKVLFQFRVKNLSFGISFFILIEKLTIFFSKKVSPSLPTRCYMLGYICHSFYGSIAPVNNIYQYFMLSTWYWLWGSVVGCSLKRPNLQIIGPLITIISIIQTNVVLKTNFIMQLTTINKNSTDHIHISWYR